MRECGECNACCFIGAVPSINKPPHRSCPYEFGNCSIFGRPERPDLCNRFQCLWLRGAGADKDRPDRSGLMLTVNELNGGKWVFAYELRDNGLDSAQSLILEVLAQVPLPVIVVRFGSKPPDDKGDLVVIPKPLRYRARGMTGSLVATWPKGIRIHQLVASN